MVTSDRESLLVLQMQAKYFSMKALLAREIYFLTELRTIYTWKLLLATKFIFYCNIKNNNNNCRENCLQFQRQTVFIWILFYFIFLKCRSRYGIDFDCTKLKHFFLIHFYNKYMWTAKQLFCNFLIKYNHLNLNCIHSNLNSIIREV